MMMPLPLPLSARDILVHGSDFDLRFRFLDELRLIYVINSYDFSEAAKRLDPTQ